MALMIFLGGTSVISYGQSTRRSRAKKSTPVTSPTPPGSEPAVISRADDANQTVILPESQDVIESEQVRSNGSESDIEEIRRAVRERQPNKYDEKQKRLLLNLDILTRAEQRVESLRRQRFELIDKENELRIKLEKADVDLRPESIERVTSLTGSLRPEEIRESRKKSLEAERASIQSLLTEVHSAKASLDTSLRRAEDLVEKLRTKLEKDIDDALSDETEKPDQ